MGESADTKSRLDLIAEAWKKDIASKKTEIENKQQELDHHQQILGITRAQESKYHQDIDRFQQQLDGLTNIQLALSKLTSAILTAFSEVQEWTPGLTAAVDVVEQYSKHLKQSDGINEMVTQSSQALNLITADIKNHQTDKRAGGRIISVILGVGLALTGLVVSILAVPVGLFLSGVPDNPAIDMWKFGGNLFDKAFNQFKQAWTGKIEPPELKNLSHQLKMLHNHYHHQVTSVTKNPYAFYTEKSSPGGSSESIKDIDNEQTASKGS